MTKKNPEEVEKLLDELPDENQVVQTDDEIPDTEFENFANEKAVLDCAKPAKKKKTAKKKGLSKEVKESLINDAIEQYMPTIEKVTSSIKNEKARENAVKTMKAAYRKMIELKLSGAWKDFLGI